MFFVGYYEIVFEFVYIEIKVIGLNDEGYIDVGGDYLEFDIVVGFFLF